LGQFQPKDAKAPKDNYMLETLLGSISNRVVLDIFNLLNANLARLHICSVQKVFGQGQTRQAGILRGIALDNNILSDSTRQQNPSR
jgi:hypothetical protein